MHLIPADILPNFERTPPLAFQDMSIIDLVMFGVLVKATARGVTTRSQVRVTAGHCALS